METVTVQQKNEVIAKFDPNMVWMTPKNKKYPPYWARMSNGVPFQIRPENWKYHTSWDWLLPVVQKINVVEWFSDGLENQWAALMKSLTDCGPNWIDEVHEAVYQFIVWHNQQQYGDNK